MAAASSARGSEPEQGPPQGHVKAQVRKFEKIKEHIKLKWQAKKVQTSPLHELEPLCRPAWQTASRVFQAEKPTSRSTDFLDLCITGPEAPMGRQLASRSMDFYSLSGFQRSAHDFQSDVLPCGSCRVSDLDAQLRRLDSDGVHQLQSCAHDLVSVAEQLASAVESDENHVGSDTGWWGGENTGCSKCSTDDGHHSRSTSAASKTPGESEYCEFDEEAGLLDAVNDLLRATYELSQEVDYSDVVDSIDAGVSWDRIYEAEEQMSHQDSIAPEFSARDSTVSASECNLGPQWWSDDTIDSLRALEASFADMRQKVYPVPPAAGYDRPSRMSTLPDEPSRGVAIAAQDLVARASQVLCQLEEATSWIGQIQMNTVSL